MLLSICSLRMPFNLLTALMGKDAGNLRKQHAFEAVEEIPEDDDATFDDDFSENDNLYVDEDGNFCAIEEIVSHNDDDLAIDDEEYHETLLGKR